VKGLYDDIINMPHHESTVHKHMSIKDRAAQFSPFAALTGYGDEIVESGRSTDKKLELTQEEMNDLNMRLQLLKMHIQEKPQIFVTYFEQDLKKSGGKYITIQDSVKHLDEVNRVLVLKSIKIPINNIYKLEGDLFSQISQY